MGFLGIPFIGLYNVFDGWINWLLERITLFKSVQRESKQETTGLLLINGILIAVGAALVLVFTIGSKALVQLLLNPL